ncbi:MAG: hypothetical protein V3W44_05165 [Dehalococcoidales bacterium]
MWAVLGISTIEGAGLAVTRQERKRWEQERWPRWEQLVRFKVIKVQQRQRRDWWQIPLPPLCSEPRTAEERQTFIDAMLADLERIGFDS